ncbi:hypothetical protein AB0383_37345 [Amycolatopsis sp. NPDC051373]
MRSRVDAATPVKVWLTVPSAGCREAIANNTFPWDDILKNAKNVSSRY